MINLRKKRLAVLKSIIFNKPSDFDRDLQAMRTLLVEGEGDKSADRRALLLVDRLLEGGDNLLTTYQLLYDLETYVANPDNVGHRAKGDRVSGPEAREIMLRLQISGRGTIRRQSWLK